MSVFWDIALVIALMMEAVSTFVTSVNFCQTTRRNNPEDSHLNSRRHEKLKSYNEYLKVEAVTFIRVKLYTSLTLQLNFLKLFNFFLQLTGLDY
jgi:hypothetical protein